MGQKAVPEAVRDLCARLRGAGHEAYPVGGCVRDLLLGREPEDWDVATSARPEAVAGLFPGAIPTGMKHGTVTVPLGGLSMEVTTFRREAGYADGRRPDAVSFDVGLAGDLARRDFTINAMALGEDGEVVDPHGGRADLRGGLIRCVGAPELRFREDALRMLRALRFSAQLGFAIEEKTLYCLRLSAGGAAVLSAERVRAELEKTLLAPWPERGEGLFHWGLLDPWLDGPAHPDLTALHRVEERPLARWAALCALLLYWGGVRDVRGFLRRLRLDRGTVSACGRGMELARTDFPWNGRGWRRALARYGGEACYAAACMGDALTGGAYLSRLRGVLESKPCVRTRDLAVTGGELLALGYSGPRIGAAQARLLRHVLDCPGDNRREILLKLLEDGQA